MNTKFLNEDQAEEAAEIIKSGGIIAIPTETVYGLAASVYNTGAIKKIFEAKGRPSDNPLIVHISDIDQVYDLVSEFPENAKKLAEKFWPGPLTMIMPKSSKVPDEVTGGMNSVAIRYPAHEVARKVIEKSGVPLVAPSANLSGKPSPTKFEHVSEDLYGKVDAIVDGGECKVGLESTVISLLSDVPKILRPGKVSAEDIKKVVGFVEIDKAVLEKLEEGQKVLSPGMKYKHYAPQTQVVMVVGDSKKYSEFVNKKSEENSVVALCFDEDIQMLKSQYISYGSISDALSQAHNLFGALRNCDKLSADIIYAHYIDCGDLSLAVYNRLVRAAGFNVINL